MEAVLVLVGLVLLRIVASAIANSSGARGLSGPRSAMLPFELRARRDNLDDDNHSTVFEIQAKGLFPISRATSVVAYTTVHDVTEGTPKPCLSFVDELQEATTPFYQFKTNLGTLRPGYGLADWARTSAVFVSVIQPPRRGRRRLKAYLHLFDEGTPAQFIFGHPTSSKGRLWVGSTEFEHGFKDAGYEEEREQRIEAREIAIQLGVCVAMSDGELADSEGAVIRDWVSKRLAAEADSQRESVKRRFNNAMKKAFSEMEAGRLRLDALLNRLADFGDSATNHEAVEFCYEILAADGVAATAELEIVRSIAKRLGLDVSQLQDIHDRAMVTLDAGSDAHASIEVTLGIDSSWDDERIKKHLRSEFTKWNSRMAVLTDPEERAAAQRMLDLIGEARKRHA